MMGKIRRLNGVMASALAAGTAAALAGEIDHYSPGGSSIRDFAMPEPGFYAGLYNYAYQSRQLNDASGNKIDSVTINSGHGPGATLGVNVDVEQYSLTPTLTWVAPWKLAAIKFGAYISPSFANSSLGAALSSVTGRALNGSASSFGMGDLFVQPLWLGLTLTNWDFALGYGFYAPVGRYRTETITLGPIGPVKATAPDNIGLGFWTQQIQGAAYWYPQADQRLAVMAALTYEINGNQEGLDLTPGQYLTLNWGISKYFPLTSSENLMLEIGPAGYDSWQITDDTGSNARNPGVHDQVHGVGGQIGITYAPWNVTLDFLYFYEFYAVDRFQGQSLSINLAFTF
jgi:hypothetical protein